MIKIQQTEVYAQWFDSLRDRQARARRLSVSGACPWATPVMCTRWEEVSRSCGSILAPGYQVVRALGLRLHAERA